MNEVTFSERLSLCKKCIVASMAIGHTRTVTFNVLNDNHKFYMNYAGVLSYVWNEEGREYGYNFDELNEWSINEFYRYFQRNHFLIRNNVDFEQLINDHNKLSSIEFDAKYFDVTW